jgi:hypothetical protein
VNEPEKTDFLKEARNELQQRITLTNNISSQLKKSYSGYSSNVAQISLLVILGLILSVFVWTLFNVEVIFGVFPTQDYGRDSLLAKAAILGLCIYVALRIYYCFIKIIKIAKIDDLLLMVRNIEKLLQTALSDLNNNIIASDAEKHIFADINEELKNEYDVDADITKYSDIAKSYSSQDINVLNVLLTIAHWISGILLVSVFLLISRSLVVENLSKWTVIKEYDLIAIFYMAFVLFLFMISQELFARNNITRLHYKIRYITGILFIIGICGIIFYSFFLPEKFPLFYNLRYATFIGYITGIAIAYLPFMIAAAFSSIMCFICKIRNHIINIIFMICSYGITLYLTAGLSSLSINQYGDIMEASFALFLPLAVTTLFSSILSIINKIKINTFLFIAAGSGIIYTIILLSIFIGMDNIAEYAIFTDFLGFFDETNKIIRVLFVIAVVAAVIITLFSAGFESGGIVIAIICGILGYFVARYLSTYLTGLIIFILAAIIPLLPGLFLLFVASRVESRFSERLRLISILLLTAISTAGFFMGRSDWKFPLPSLVHTSTENTRKVTVISDGLNLRAGPSINAEIIKQLYKGDILNVIGDVQYGWTPVEHEGVKGWVSSELIE